MLGNKPGNEGRVLRTYMYTGQQWLDLMPQLLLYDQHGGRVTVAEIRDQFVPVGRA